MSLWGFTAQHLALDHTFFSSNIHTVQEKVEEDRFIREKEHEAYLARKDKENAKKAQAELTAAQKVAKQQHDKAVAELFGVLSKTGDKLSDAAVENLANWKVGHH